MKRGLIWAFLICAALSTPAAAHEVRPAYLQLTEIEPNTFDVLWKTPARGQRRLGLYVRFPADCEQLTEPTAVFQGSAHVERWRIRHHDALIGSLITIDGLSTTRTDVLVRIERLDGSALVARIGPSQPSLMVTASPGVATTYLALGVEHILFGVDHLLFVLSLMLLVVGWRRLIETITAFTLAHSVTLALATLGVVHIPVPPVEAAIALSIVFVAAEIVRARRGQRPLAARSPWLIAAAFGLLHGLGFAGALAQIGMPDHAVPLALFFFNLGVEFGQLIFVAAVALVITLARRTRIRPQRGRLVLPYVIGSVAMFWVIERISAF